MDFCLIGRFRQTPNDFFKASLFALGFDLRPGLNEGTFTRPEVGEGVNTVFPLPRICQARRPSPPRRHVC